jgi:coenzyme PQQ precursor peptide PqqA
MRAPRALRHLQGSSKQHGDAKLTLLFQTLADYRKARSASIYDRCKARLMNTPASTPRCIEPIFVSSEGIKAQVAELTRCAPHQRAQTRRRNDAMVWSTPEVREVCVGMEVTSYLSAEM